MQDVRTPSPHVSSPKAINLSDEYDVEPEARRPKLRRKAGGGRGKRRIVYLGVIVFALLVVGFLTSFFLRGAELTVYPKFKEVTVAAAFTARQDPDANTLGYELLTLEETGERTVAATGSEPVEEHATGELTLYNAFSKEPQRLIKNTRFESKDGLVFKVSDSVMIPGYTTDNAGKKVPGTVTAKVFADATGDKSNGASGRFTVPGLKGTPQFAEVYAESVAPMQGGFVGQKLIVEDSVLTSTKEAIRNDLREKLSERLESERPASFVLYDTAASIRFESLPSVDAGENKATIREKAILEVPLFAEGDLARYLAKNTIVEYKNEDVQMENPHSLAFSYATASSTEAISSKKNIDFKLNGNVKIIWKYDTEKLRNDLKGVSKDELQTILLKNHPAIERATTVMRPFWKQSFPDDPAKIKIIQMLGSQ